SLGTVLLLLERSRRTVPMLHPQTLNRYDQDKDSFDRELGDAVGAQLLPTSQNESPLFCLTPNGTRVWENL
ncbi:MAG: hypothetical protein WBJ05_00030, partial [Bacillota bacterium]